MQIAVVVDRYGRRLVAGALLSLVLFACTQPAPREAVPPPRPAPTESPSVAATSPPPEEDVDGIPTAVDFDPPPPPFDPVAWLSQRGVTEPIPENTQCTEALPSIPGRPDMLLCNTSKQVYSAGGTRVNYSYFARHTIVLAASGKTLRKVFDVITALRPFDAVSRKTARTLDLVVRVEDSGTAIVVEDGDDANCPSALALYGQSGNAAKQKYLENVCKGRGRYVFLKGRFLPAR